MLNRKLKLAPHVIKKKEEKLLKFCFYNAKDKTFSNLDYPMGIMISALDGSLTTSEVLEIVASNNQNIDAYTLKESLLANLKFLYEEGFLVEVI